MDKLDTVIQQFGEYAERVTDDLLHYKIVAASALRVADERQDRIDEMEVEIEGNNERIRQLEAALDRIEKNDTIRIEEHDPIYGKFARIARDAKNGVLQGSSEPVSVAQSPLDGADT